LTPDLAACKFGWIVIDDRQSGRPPPGTDRAAEICALNDTFDALAKQEPRRAKVIELRYFGGLSVEETAEALGVSAQTVLRDWKLARAWLAVELRNSSRP
jgi:RNA polymerase sigma-70 factor (ECF subfamily)